MLTPPKDSLYHYIKYGIHYVDIQRRGDWGADAIEITRSTGSKPRM